MKGPGVVLFLAVLLVSFAIGFSTDAAQDRAADEKAIRAAIAATDVGADNRPRMVADGVFWSGAYKYPVYSSKEKPVAIDHRLVTDRVQGAEGTSLRKQRTTVRKLEVAQAGDMAYEVSDIELTMPIKTAKGIEPDTFMTSMLRVWKKVDGVWRPSANFNFAHDGSYPNPSGPRAR